MNAGSFSSRRSARFRIGASLGHGAFGDVVRAFDNVISVNQGFDPRDVDVVSLDLTMGGYTNATGGDVVRRLRERVRALPGVERTSIAEADGSGTAGAGAGGGALPASANCRFR